MFPKYKSFYLTLLFKVLCEVWLIYYINTFNVIAKKNGALYFFMLMLMLLRKLCIWLKQLKHWRKSIALLTAYKPYTQSPENILSVLVTLGCYRYNFVTRTGNFSLNMLNKGQITQNMQVFNVLEIVYSTI